MDLASTTANRKVTAIPQQVIRTFLGTSARLFADHNDLAHWAKAVPVLDANDPGMDAHLHHAVVVRCRARLRRRGRTGSSLDPDPAA